MTTIADRNKMTLDTTDASQVVEALSSYINNMGHDNAEFAEAVGRLHRTLQQNVMRSFIECVKMWAEQKADGRYDARNEATVKIADKLVNALGPDELYTPFI